MSLLPDDLKAYENMLACHDRAKKGRYAYHFDLEQCLVAVVQQIPGLSAVYSDDTEKQLASHSESHWGLRRHDNLLNALCEVRLKDVLLGQLALQVCRQPDPGQGPGLLEEFLRIEHGRDGGAAKVVEQSSGRDNSREILSKNMM